MDDAVHDLGGDHIGVEEEANFGFQDDLFVEEQVPLGVNAGRVAGGVLEAEFLDDAGLTGAGFGAVAIGTYDVHFDFAGGVAAENGAVLDEDDAGAVACGGDSGADAGKAAAGYKKVTID